jgi:hypothetical protein
LYRKPTVRGCHYRRLYRSNEYSAVEQLQNDPDFQEWAQRKLRLDDDERRNELENERAQWSAFVSAAFQQQPKVNIAVEPQPSRTENSNENVPLTTNKARPKDHSAAVQGTLRARPGPRPLIKQAETVDMHVSFQDKGPVPPGKLRVECIEGVYQGTYWMVTPLVFKSKAKKDVKIGRSNSKAMKDYGICLSEDTEVSTRHGAITVEGTTFYYHDTESTNGSYLLPSETALAPQTKVEITNGSRIRVGQEVLLFTF